MGLAKYVKRGSQDLSSAAFSLEQSVTDDEMKIVQVLLAASTGITETVKVTYKSSAGSNYDVVLDSTDLSSESNYAYNSKFVIEGGGSIELACTNGNATGIVYGTIMLEPA